MSARKKRFSIHHCQPQSAENEGFNVHEDDNKVRIRHHRHEGIHRLFDDKKVHEQFLFLLELNHRILQMEVRRAMKSIMKLPAGEIYDDMLLSDTFDDKLDEEERESLREDCIEMLHRLLDILEHHDHETVD